MDEEEEAQVSVEATSQPESWRDALKRAASTLMEDERVSRALDSTKHAASASGRSVATGLEKARGQFTQEEAWSAVEATLQELIGVLRVQHAKIQQLADRIEQLERREKS